MQIDDGGAVALITLLSAAAIGPAKGLADMLTMAFPARPTWVGPLSAMGFGVVLVFLTAIAYGVSINTQSGAMCILAGIGAGLAAAGITSTGNTAETKRQDAKTSSDPF